MKRTVNALCSGMVVLCLCLVWSSLYGFDEKQVQALKKTNSCKKCDLSGAKLSNMDLSYADLASANLSGADLYNSNLTGADRTEAHPSGENFSGGNFS